MVFGRCGLRELWLIRHMACYCRHINTLAVRSTSYLVYSPAIVLDIISLMDLASLDNDKNGPHV